MRSIGFLAAAAGALWLSACQRYPFEQRLPKRSQVQKLTEVVATTRPTDILFVIDNSGTMQEERAAVSLSVQRFLEQLVQTNVDFQVGVITTDVDCNVPTNDCLDPAWATSGKTNQSCCQTRGSLPPCEDLDTNGDGVVDTSTCDGGRLREVYGRRIFARPSAGGEQQWVADLQSLIATLDCDITSNPVVPEGSRYEAGLEAAARAVSCSAGQACPDAAVARLDAGFVRPDADLVVIFISDEDDCSFRPYDDGTTAYDHVLTPSDLNTQQKRLCSAAECYGGYVPLLDWPSQTFFSCGDSQSVLRSVPPPAPTEVGTYLDALVAAKGGDVRRIRAAAIVGGKADATAAVGFGAAGCYTLAGKPSTACGCLSTDTSLFYCQLTASLGQAGARTPALTGTTPYCKGLSIPVLGGCTGLPGTRYTRFLQQLADRRVAAGGGGDVLADSICQTYYDDTLYDIVNNVIVKNCWDLGVVPTQVSDIQVTLNGEPLYNVPKGSRLQGWSWVEGTSEVCLEGGLKKTIDDRFEVYVLESSD